MVPPVLQEKQIRAPLNTRATRPRDGRAAGRDEVKVTAGPLQAAAEVDPAQARSVIKTRPPSDPVGPLGVAALLALLEAPLGPRAGRTPLAGLRRATSSSA